MYPEISTSRASLLIPSKPLSVVADKPSPSTQMSSTNKLLHGVDNVNSGDIDLMLNKCKETFLGNGRPVAVDHDYDIPHLTMSPVRQRSRILAATYCFDMKSNDSIDISNDDIAATSSTVNTYDHKNISGYDSDDYDDSMSSDWSSASFGNHSSISLKQRLMSRLVGPLPENSEVRVTQCDNYGNPRVSIL
jgi:hypothetical protein